jgi:hypothetical protein
VDRQKAIQLAKQHYSNLVMSGKNGETVKEASEFWRIVMEALENERSE